MGVIMGRKHRNRTQRLNTEVIMEKKTFRWNLKTKFYSNYKEKSTKIESKLNSKTTIRCQITI